MINHFLIISDLTILIIAISDLFDLLPDRDLDLLDLFDFLCLDDDLDLRLSLDDLRDLDLERDLLRRWRSLERDLKRKQFYKFT